MIEGDSKLLSVVANGLPTTEDFEHVTDLEILKVPPVPMDKFLYLFIGLISTANNFKRRIVVLKRRIVVRRTGVSCVGSDHLIEDPSSCFDCIFIHYVLGYTLSQDNTLQNFVKTLLVFCLF
uniref:Hexosyltransferase n=1 Tax=Triticum urartu TaxID=4572 RepID=A0A8R7TRI0_TRIUA